jgi:hypothetical protein
MTLRTVGKSIGALMSVAAVIALTSTSPAAQPIVIQPGSADSIALAMATDPDAPRLPAHQSLLRTLGHRTRATGKALWHLAVPHG